jgi:hypothetical protein
VTIRAGSGAANGISTRAKAIIGQSIKTLASQALGFA